MWAIKRTLVKIVPQSFQQLAVGSHLEEIARMANYRSYWNCHLYKETDVHISAVAESGL